MDAELQQVRAVTAGDRTRLACTFRRPRRNALPPNSTVAKAKKFATARTCSPARLEACAPRNTTGPPRRSAGSGSP